MSPFRLDPVRGWVYVPEPNQSTPEPPWNPQPFEPRQIDWNARAPDEAPKGPPESDIFSPVTPVSQYGFDLSILKSMVRGYEEVTRALPAAAIDRLAQVTAAAYKSPGGFNPDLSYPGKWAPQWGSGPVTVGQARDALFSASFAVGRRMSGEIFEQAGGGQQGIAAQEEFLQNFSVGSLQAMSVYDRSRGDALRFITMSGRNFAREQYRAMRNPAMPFSALGEEGTEEQPSVLDTLRTEGDFANMAAPPRQPEWFEQIQIPKGGIPLHGVSGIPRVTQNVLDRAIPYWMSGGGAKLAALTPEARDVASKALAAIRRAITPYALGGNAGPEEVNPLTASLEASQNNLHDRPDQGFLGGPTIGNQSPEYDLSLPEFLQRKADTRLLAQAGLIQDPMMAMSQAQRAMVVGTRTVTDLTYPENKTNQKAYAESTFYPAAGLSPTVFTPEGALEARPRLLLSAKAGQPGPTLPPEPVAPPIALPSRSESLRAGPAGLNDWATEARRTLAAQGGWTPNQGIPPMEEAPGESISPERAAELGRMAPSETPAAQRLASLQAEIGAGFQAPESGRVDRMRELMAKPALTPDEEQEYRQYTADERRTAANGFNPEQSLPGMGGIGERSIEDLKRQAITPNAPKFTPEEYQRLVAFEKANYADPLDDPTTARLKQVTRSTLPEEPSLEDQRFYARRLHDVLNPYTIRPRPAGEIDNSANTSIGMGGSRRDPTTSDVAKRNATQMQGALSARMDEAQRVARMQVILGGENLTAENDPSGIAKPRSEEPPSGVMTGHAAAAADTFDEQRLAASQGGASATPSIVATEEPIIRDTPGGGPALFKEEWLQRHGEDANKQPGTPGFDRLAPGLKAGIIQLRKDRLSPAQNPANAAWVENAQKTEQAQTAGQVPAGTHPARAQADFAAEAAQRAAVFEQDKPAAFQAMRDAIPTPENAEVSPLGKFRASGDWTSLSGTRVTLAAGYHQEVQQFLEGALKDIDPGKLSSNPASAAGEIRQQIEDAWKKYSIKFGEKIVAETGDPTKAKEIASGMGSDFQAGMRRISSAFAKETGQPYGVAAGMDRGATMLSREEMAAKAAYSPAMRAAIAELGGGDFAKGMRVAEAQGNIISGEEGAGAYRIGGETGFAGAGRGAGAGGSVWRRMGAPGQVLYGAYIAKRMLTMFAGQEIQQEQAYEQYTAQTLPLSYRGMAGEMDLSGTAAGAVGARQAAQLNMGRGAYNVYGQLAQGYNRWVGSLGPAGATAISGGGLAMATGSIGMIGAGMISQAPGVVGTALGEALAGGATGIGIAVGLGVAAYAGFQALRANDVAGLTAEGRVQVSTAEAMSQVPVAGAPVTGRAGTGGQGQAPLISGRAGGGQLVINEGYSQYGVTNVWSRAATPAELQQQRQFQQLQAAAGVIGTGLGTGSSEAIMQYAANVQALTGLQGAGAGSWGLRIAQEAESRGFQAAPYLNQAAGYAASMQLIQGTDAFSQAMRQYALAPAQQQTQLDFEGRYTQSAADQIRQSMMGGGVRPSQVVGQRQGGQRVTSIDDYATRRTPTTTPITMGDYYQSLFGPEAMGAVQRNLSLGIMDTLGAYGGAGAMNQYAPAVAVAGTPAATLLSGMAQGNLGAWSWAAWQGVQTPGGTAQIPNAAAYRFQDLSGNPIYETSMRGMMDLMSASPQARYGGATGAQTAAMAGRYTGQQAPQTTGDFLTSMGINITNPAMARAAQGSMREWRTTLQGEQMQVMEAGIASQQQGIAAQQRYLWGGGAWTGTPSAGSLWGLQGQQREMGYQAQQYNFAYSGQRMDVQNQFAVVQEQITGQRMDTSNQYARWQMGFQRGGEMLQRGWQREDYQYQDTMRGLQTGWQMEDINEGIRLSSGRDRRHLVEQRERMTLTTNLEGQQIDKTRQRQEELWAREDEAYRKEKAHQEAMIQLDERQFKLSKAQREENYNAEKAHLTWQMVEYQKEYDLETQIIKLQHDYQAGELERSEAMANLQARLTRDQAEYSKAVTLMSEAYGDISGYVKNLMQYQGLDAIYGPLQEILEIIAGMDPAKLKSLAKFVAGLK